jgi:hypothetical protein
MSPFNFDEKSSSNKFSTFRQDTNLKTFPVLSHPFTEVSKHFHPSLIFESKTGNTKGGSIIVPLTSCLTGLD